MIFLKKNFITKQCTFSNKLLPVILFLTIFVVVIEQPKTTVINQANADNGSNNWQDGNLMIELAPALCKINPDYSKYRQCSEKTPYVIKGFDMGQMSSARYESHKKIAPLQAKMLNRLMPDERVQKKSWNEYGSFGKYSQSKYFRQIIEYSAQFQVPQQISSSESGKVSKISVIKQLKHDNAGLMDSSVRLLCQPYQSESILVRVDVCFKSGKFQRCDGDIGKNYKNNIDVCDGEFNLVGY